MRNKTCFYCGQVLPEMRLGIRLTALKARIFDLIMRGGEDGISGADLLDIVGLQGTCLKSHIWQINELIEDQGYRIKGKPGRGNVWRLVKHAP